jgi:uncharacterized protein YkwD
MGRVRHHRNISIVWALFAASLLPGVLALAPASEMSIRDDEQRYAVELARLINDYRERRGLERLATSDKLAELAGRHSAQMAAARKLGHQGFEQRFTQSGYAVCVENVGWNAATPAAEIDRWQRSDLHNKNLLDRRIGVMGIGARSGYVTFIACAARPGSG